YFLLLFFNPYTSLNPLRPNTPTPPIVLPSATITPLQLSEPWTQTPTIQPTVTETPRPTFTPIPSETPVRLYTVTFTPPPPTATATPQMPFEADIQLISSTIIHSETDCNWLGVGGTVKDINQSPMLGVVVRVQGSLVGENVDFMTVSGVSQAYGQSGFEFVLGDLPLPSSDSLWIRVFDTAGLPLSDQIFFSTLGDCDKNLVLVHFKQVR
ncbi:MAG: hypothetical protein HN741_06260, partial [Anaerolineae bacterium]|nr:hypothetical protein [Anaerolineae bacterium]